jgi:hypothetical protein
MIRPGKPHDLYYASEDNLARQAIPTTVNTRFRLVLSNPNQGVSVLTIPPNAGVSQLVLVMGYSASSLSAQTGINALPQGWGYSAVRQISYRIGSSTQYFMTGSQLLQRAMRQCKTQNQRESILQLGGSAVYQTGGSGTGAAGTGNFGVDQFAYVCLPIWCPPACDEFNPVLATDLLSSQLQITVELNPSAQFWISNATSTAPAVALPTGFDKAYVQVEQIEPDNRGDLLANRVDMDKSMYVQPLQSFDQQEFQIPVLRTASSDVNGNPTPVTLTGFRSGSCNNIILYLTNDDEQAGSGGAAKTSFTKWYAPLRVTMSYAGLIYVDYQDATSAIFNLVDSTSPAQVATTTLVAVAAPGASVPQWTAVSTPCVWSNCPFAQPSGSDFTVDTLVEGKEIQNGIVNLLISPPATDSAGNALTRNFTLHAVYSYNAAIAYSRGTAELLF